jgi:hypothetical protein
MKTVSTPLQLTMGVEARHRNQYLFSDHYLNHLLPLKARLAASDRLIDRLVYRLYGLTEEEVARVEGGHVAEE